MGDGLGDAVIDRPDREYDAVVVGAGFSGMYQLHKLRQLGLHAVAIERGPDVGGTWFWNRYPGARCDITSMDYSFSFDEELQMEWEWTEKFATQPEILRYAQHVAERFDLYPDIEFSTTVTTTCWDGEAARWITSVTSADDNGAAVPNSPVRTLSSRFLILAVGNLSSTNIPDIPGLDTFAGRTIHTAMWPREGVDFTGRRVGVIGTGSSGIQAIPVLAQQAAHLIVFHRTPNFSLPAHNRLLTPDEVAAHKATYSEYREAARWSYTGVPVPVPTQSVFDVTDEERERVFEEAWESGVYGKLLASFTDLSTDAEANELAARFIRAKVRNIVDDPSVSAVLEPRGNYFGTKRSCLDSGYYETFNRDNVTLVDVRSDPICRIEAGGVRTAGDLYSCDDLVLATGFDAMTGSLLAINPIGVDGVSLREAWAAGPFTYLGVASHGFPNLFFITGPGSPSVLSNMIVSIEQHVDWVTALIKMMACRGIATAEVTEKAQRDWMATVHDEAAATLYLSGNSWYLGANIPGKPRVFMPYVGGVGKYRGIATRVAEQGYPGFELN